MNDKEVVKTEVVAVAKKNKSASSLGEHVLSTGVHVRIVPVGARLLTESMAMVPEPKVPMWFDPERNKEIENPNDPSYNRAIDERETKQSNVAMDALIMFGVELLGGMPEDDGWLRKLKLLSKAGALDLSMYDLDDADDREFLYKKFIAVAAADLQLLQGASGLITTEDLAEAENFFPGDETRKEDI